MPINPLSDWTSQYKDQLNSYYDQLELVPTLPIQEFWQPYVHSQFGTIQGAAPWAAAQGTLDESSFGPIVFPPTGTPPVIAGVLASAWSSYVSAIVWAVPPPALPFDTIATVTIEPASLAAGVASITSGLVAEFAVLYPNPRVYLDLKAKAVGTIFYTATAALQILITGTAPGPTPLSLPFPIQ